MNKHVHIHLPARDADFKESNVKRDEGGKFSAQQHQAAAAHHEAEAAKHDQQYKQTSEGSQATARNAHQEAADLHKTAAGHVNAQTSWASHNAQQAHNATAQAQKASSAVQGPADLDQLKAIAADPKQPIGARAEAVKQLEGLQRQADVVAASPLAVPQPAPAPAAHATSQFNVANISPEMKAKLAKLAPAIKAQQEGGNTTPTPKRDPGAKARAKAKLEAYFKAKGNVPKPAAPAATKPATPQPTAAPSGGVQAAKGASYAGAPAFKLNSMKLSPEDQAWMKKSGEATMAKLHADLKAMTPAYKAPDQPVTVHPGDNFEPGFKIPPKPEYAPPKASYSANVAPPELAGKKLSYAALKKAFQSGKRINMKAK